MAEAVGAVHNVPSYRDDPEYWAAYEKKIDAQEKALIEKAKSNPILKDLHWETPQDAHRAFAAIGRFFVDRMTVEQFRQELMKL